MFNGSLETFLRYYTIPNVDLNLFLFSLGLVILYGIVWLSPFLPPLLKNRWLWAVFFGSILITTLATAFVQFPLQRMASQPLIGGLNKQYGEVTTYIIAGIVIALITALVQQGAKLVPVCLYWWRKKAQFTPQSGLIIGAVAGAGFGLIEAFMRHNQILGIGLNQLMQSEGFIVILVFLERFFSVAFHVGTTAVAGWGLARGKGWQFYLIVAAIQFVFNYVSVLLSAKILNVVAAEIVLYLISMGVMAWALWLLWGKNKEKTQSGT